MLAKPLRIRKSADFARIYKTHRSKACPSLVIYKKENDLDHPRFGFSISKKVGKAYMRNLLRRRLSEIIRLHLDGFEACDLVIIARYPAAALSYQALEKEFLKLAERSGIYHDRTH
jgi:ribonuclease P protein component